MKSDSGDELLFRVDMQIQRLFKGERKQVLLWSPTPIGNREDMSYRMVQTLKDVDFDRSWRILEIQASFAQAF